MVAWLRSGRHQSPLMGPTALVPGRDARQYFSYLPTREHVMDRLASTTLIIPEVENYRDSTFMALLPGLVSCKYESRSCGTKLAEAN